MSDPLQASRDIAETSEVSLTDDVAFLWSQVLELLKTELNTASFKTWFEHTSPLGFDEKGRFVVGVQNEFARSWIAGRYTPRLTNAVRALTGLDLDVSVVVDPALATVAEADDHDEPTEIPVYEPVAVDVSEQTTAFNPKFTFDSFVSSDSNIFARNAALAVAEQPGLKYSPLFIWGDSGLGKTHLLQAIGNYVTQHLPHKRVIYVTSEQYMNDFTNSVRTNIQDDFRKKYRSADVLLIDDIQYIEGKPGTQEQLFHAFNEFQQHGKAVVLASDRSPKALNMDDRYRSRFASGLPVDIQPPNFETRLAILQQYISLQRSLFDEDALVYLAERSSPNIRELEGAVNRCSAMMGLTRRDRVDISIVQQVVGDLFPEQVKRAVSISTIQKEVCKHYGISHADIIGNKRSQNIVYPRQIAMYLARELTDLSLPAIGREFGGRDHTTVLHAQAKIQKLIRSNRDVYNEIHHLTRTINTRV